MNYLSNNFDPDDPGLVSALDEFSFWSAPFGQLMLETVRLKRGSAALDIGCGTGFLLLELAQRLGAGSKVFGIDPWRAALNRARAKLDIYQVTNVELVEGFAESLPFADGTFDLITSNNGINNCEDQPGVLRECYRTAKSGCQLVITQNLPGTMHEFYDLFKSLLIEKGHPGKAGLVDQYIASKRKTVSEMSALIIKSGFSIEGIAESSFRYRFVDGTAMFGYFMFRLAFMDHWKKIVEDIGPEEFFAEMEETLNMMAEFSGELSLTVPMVCFDCSKD